MQQKTHAPRNRLASPGACYRKHEKEKRRMYEEKIREVEHVSFTPLVFSAKGGTGVAEIFYKRLASLISERKEQQYGTTMAWIRCYISFDRQ